MQKWRFGIIIHICDAINTFLLPEDSSTLNSFDSSVNVEIKFVKLAKISEILFNGRSVWQNIFFILDTDRCIYKKYLHIT